VKETEWRIFCAVELPDEIRDRLHDHAKWVREAVPEASASWSRPENVHLTLKFFGNIATKKLPLISDVASRVAKNPWFQIGIGGTGVFPKPNRAQVLWIGVDDPSGRLSALQMRLEEEFAAEGFPKEDRAYRPHLTIARLRKPEGSRRLAETHLQTSFKKTQITVSEFVVFRSELSSNGSRYTAISRHELS
jgi:2'-5' RNA ligase